MSDDVVRHRDEGLRHQDTVTASIVATAGALDQAGWATATNCPPWDVTMLIAHMTRGAESFMTIVKNGLQGITELTQTAEERQRRQAELAALSSADLLATFGQNQQSYRALLAGISDSDLARPGRHAWGMQPLWWFGDQRLAELAFHNWDLHHSLGHEQEIDAKVARYLVPTIIERNVKAFYKASPTHSGHWVIRASDVKDGTWLVEPYAEGVAMTRGPAEGDVVIQGDAAALLRWLYGRADMKDLEHAGRSQVSGSRERVSAWADMFPAP
jgi:uncharacterized protein (TIGR03083 family)